MSELLKPHNTRRAPEGPVTIVVMDGVGIGAGDESDAVALAHTPTLDWLRSLASSRQLLAHGKAVGMPSDEDMGNSEVGHNALGAGRVFAQGAKLVAQAIESGAIFEGARWQEAVRTVMQSGEALHFLGLFSDGNIHSNIAHLEAMLRRAAKEGVRRARLHLLTDGRDVDGRSALRYISRINSLLAELGAQGLDYQIASGGGRMRYTMDRYEADWSMVERGWNLHVHGQGRPFRSAEEAVETLYAENEKDDQWLEGFVIVDDKGPVGTIKNGAAVIFYNFRGDRAIEISRAFDDEEFPYFDRGLRPKVYYAGMMEYDGDLHIPRQYLVEPPKIDRSMGELLAASGKRQLAIAETHKFGHVTYFWNGNRSGAFDPSRETYIEVPSDLDALEQRPWMKAAEVTDRLVAEALRERYDLIRVNYANGDMVGHTGDLRAARIAVEAVDLSLARLVALTKQQKGVLIVTADHGNADQMFEIKGGKSSVKTSHTLNPVPFVIYDPREAAQGPTLRAHNAPEFSGQAGLANVAATSLELLGFARPEGYLPSLLSDLK